MIFGVHAAPITPMHSVSEHEAGGEGLRFFLTFNDIKIGYQCETWKSRNQENVSLLW
ncbi:hypothetical protein AGR4A_pAt10172 [Agrobacterium tumefaciens str. B6]|uniref:Uncharacterized protein n=1 Tax=Agrobacterium tumefaciens str. B6 TaxID=1183423 RepID=A0A822VA51_AGRTU|nr:hypothetical protein AGR4A_pAt10172 [Agrobacterium tumefaciens str. B6]